MEDNLSLLVVGSGGREFAIAKALLASPHVATVYCAPGNVGMKAIGVQTVDIDEMDLDGLLDFAKKNHVAWTFVGPENVLCAGIVDKFHDAGQKNFWPQSAGCSARRVERLCPAVYGQVRGSNCQA